MHFDWPTLALQAINVLVLLWLLRRFLFRPVVAIIAERQAAAEKLLADAAVAREQAQAVAAQAAQRETALAADSDHILTEARAAAEAERTRLLEQTTQEAAQTRDAAQAGLQGDRIQMRRELEGEACDLAVTIASRLLTRVPAQALNAALLQSLDTWLATVPRDKLDTLAQSGEPLEVVTAAPLDGQTQAACAEMLKRYLGPVATFRFTADASLIAGVELRGSHGRLCNNWRADLAQIALELNRPGSDPAKAELVGSVPAGAEPG
jgi:F-type H+-transporting ATPase subunit b